MSQHPETGANVLNRFLQKLRRMARFHDHQLAQSQAQNHIHEAQLETLDEIKALLREQNALTAEQTKSITALLREVSGFSSEIRSLTADLNWKLTGALRDSAWRHFQDGRTPHDLIGTTAQIYSQTTEDSLIAEIFSRIGERDRFFVEFGIEDGTENTSRWLLEQGWRGIWVEGSTASVQRASTIFAGPISEGRLTIVESMAGPDNANDLLSRAGAPEAFDYLSVDIDHNTAHVWAALKARARVCCVEYNAALPPSTDIVVPYKADHGWDGTNWFGASLKALERIGSHKGMALVGCDFTGVNAYFVQLEEAKGVFSEPFTAEAKYQPPRYHLVGKGGHPPSPKYRSWQVAPAPPSR